jgi:hypothetical protein
MSANSFVLNRVFRLLRLKSIFFAFSAHLPPPRGRVRTRSALAGRVCLGSTKIAYYVSTPLSSAKMQGGEEGDGGETFAGSQIVKPSWLAQALFLRLFA